MWKGFPSEWLPDLMGGGRIEERIEGGEGMHLAMDFQIFVGAVLFPPEAEGHSALVPPPSNFGKI